MESVNQPSIQDLFLLCAFPVSPELIPLNLTAETINPFNITLQWARPTKAHPVEYRVIYGIYKCKDREGNRVYKHRKLNEIKVPADTEILYIGELFPFTKFKVTVTAVPEDGSSFSKSFCDHFQGYYHCFE